jgi:two-component system chemotaxis response regulator CheB
MFQRIDCAARKADLRSMKRPGKKHERSARAVDSEPLGRAAVDDGALTDLGCPDCRGVLAVRKAGELGLVSFRCRVGHAFTAETLLPAKEDQVEEALWTAIELYGEVAMLHRWLAKRARATKQPALAVSLERRGATAEDHAKKLRSIVGEDEPAEITSKAERRP